MNSIVHSSAPHFLAFTLAIVGPFSASRASGASVEPQGGYANSFDVHPSPADWTTFSRPGAAADNYDLDVEVGTNENLTATLMTAPTVADAGNPPPKIGNAAWSSTGFYLQTRPTGNRYTALMGRFVNHTGTNATQIGISYLLTIAGGGVAEDAGKGTHVFYSLTGGVNGWTNLPSLNNSSSANSSSVLSASLSLDWTNGAALYLLWVDDNANAQGDDSANQIDDFTLQVTAGTPVSTALACLLNSPTNNATLPSGSPLQATVSVALGTPPYSVEYFLSHGTGTFQSAGTTATPPFGLEIDNLTAGTYQLYAVATDGAGTPAQAFTVTNTFAVADPLAVALDAPADGAAIDVNVSVIGRASVGGGTAPYSVQFYLDDLAAGAPVTSSPYEHDLGILFVGDHRIQARATDARGWSSNSFLHTLHVNGPLAVELAPTNGASHLFGESIILAAAVGGGKSPYSIAFYTNEQPVAILSAPPFTVNLGLLPPGIYTASAQATDSSTPLSQQAGSTTNAFTVLENPLTATLTSPSNGESATAGQAFSLGAIAGVGAPLTVAGVEFFLDGASVGADTTAPYSASYASPIVGTHAVFAIATDSLGRKQATATNQLTVVAAPSGPPPNDAFANATVLTGPILTIHASNVGATKQFPGEPIFAGNFGGASVWWAWTATASGQTTIDTSGSDFNTLLGVFTGTAVNQLTLVGANNDYNGNTWSRVQFDATAGTTYKIVVDGAAPGGFPPRPATGNIVLNIQGVGGLTIDTPTNGMVFNLGDPVPMQVTISSDFPNPPASRVDFYAGGTLFGSSAAEPFSAVATNLPPGSNDLYVVAFDNNGQPVQSPVVTVFVQTIGVTLLTPRDGTTFLNTNPITVTAHGYVPGGAITNIEFFVDGLSFGQDDSAPFAAVWSAVTGGSHRFTALGRSDTGAAYNSLPLNFAVAELLVHSNSVWKYLDDGSDQGTTWISPTFDDSAWASGPAELGYGDGDEATVVHSGPTNNYYITTYFRQTFLASNTAAFTNLNFLLAYDDAAVVYLNGTELYRTANLPAAPAPITYTNFATGAAIEETVDVFTRGATNLLEGTNVLAVEIHQQARTSSDISFFLQVLGLPIIIRNVSPAVAITNPTNGAFFVGTPPVPIEAAATDEDGSVAKVAFFADGVNVGETTNSPYRIVWSNPPVGLHLLTAVATDDLGASTVSDEVPIVVYDAAGTPVTHLTAPADGAVMEGPTNLLVTATANAVDGVTNVEFLANGAVFGQAGTSPYAALWNAPFGTNILATIVHDANGVTGTSAPVRVVITIPPTNFIAPTIARQVPSAFATVTNLTNIVITFSERVHNVDAGDFLINGVPATRVIGTGSNYTFYFPQPAYGEVEIAWARDHGILDFGYPADLPFNELDPASQWEYTLIDKTPPAIVSRSPAAGSTVTNLPEVIVTFSEPVNGVSAGDLLVNGTPAAFNLASNGNTYTFSVSQPASGTVNISWATNHGIFDQAEVPNAFLATGPGAAWSFTLDARTSLIESNSTWKFVKGFGEASTPVEAWRQLGFDDSSWSNAPAPFFFGDPYTNATITGTLLSDMASNYTSIFLRREFTVKNRSTVTALFLNAQSDDGFIAWLNGVEVLRYNMPAGDIPFDGTASSPVPEAFSGGANYILYRLTNAVALLLNGTNELAVEAFNQSLTNSSDFGFNAHLYAFATDFSTVPPRLAEANPAPGDVLALTNVTITFTEGVTGVDAADLLVNGVPATSVVSSNESTYTFAFTQPAYGDVTLSFAADHGIMDLDDTPKPFDSSAANATLSYTLVSPNTPRIASQTPAAGSTLTNLTTITVTFTKSVTGVNASDLLVNGVPASRVSGGGASYRFFVTQPPFGTAFITWATNHGIHDSDVPPNNFDPTKFGGQWTYHLIDPVPSVALTNPTNDTYIVGPTNVTLRATASDNDGTVALVEFYEGTTKLGEGTNAPYSVIWSNVALGSYLLRAVATDDIGLRGTSAPVVLNVVTSLPAALVRGPYLQVGSPTGGVVRWRTDLDSDSIVAYGTDAANLSQVVALPAQTNEHIVALAGLEPDTKYYYSIGSSSRTLGSGTNYWFKTSPPVGTERPTRLWVLGDSGTGNNNARNVRDAYYAYAATNRPADLWLMLGDNAYNSGLDTEYQSAVFDMYPNTLRNLFLWPTIGNHETAQAFDIADFPYLHIFTLPQQGEAGGIPSGTPRYYSFDYANIHFVCLDSMSSGRTATNAMSQWLRNDLAATTQNWVIVFFHHPPYTKGNHDSDRETELIEIRQNILPILETNGVDLVFTGHSHAWERSYFLHGHYGDSSTLTPAMKIDGGDGRADGTGVYRKNALGQGVVYTVAGNSGQITGGSLNHPANFLSLNELGSMVVDVTSNRIDVVLLATNGVFRDHYTVAKRAPEVPPQGIPDAPANLLVSAGTATEFYRSQLILRWHDRSTNEAGFIIERSTDGNTFAPVATVDADVTLYIDRNLASATAYLYRVRSTNALGVSAPSNVDGDQTHPQSDLVAVGETAVFHAGIEGTPPVRYQWRYEETPIFGETNESLVLPHVQFADEGAYSVVITDALGPAASNPAFLYVMAAPVIVENPASRTVIAGSSTALRVTAEGSDPLRYQWRKNGQNVPGANSPELVFAAVSQSDQGDYDVVVANDVGTVISQAAHLIVNTPPLARTDLVYRTRGQNLAVDIADLMANDEDPDAEGVTFSGVSSASSHGAEISWKGRFVLYTPPPDFNADDTFTYTIADARGAVGVGLVNIAVTDNNAPVLAAIPDRMAQVLTALVVTNAATDRDVANKLTFTLEPGAPANAKLDPVTGIFHWIPTRQQAASTNIISIRVVDDGQPPLSSRHSFTVVVNDYLELSAGSAVLNAGESGVVPLGLFSSTGVASLQCLVHFDEQRLLNVAAESTDPQAATASLQPAGAHGALLTITTLPGHALQGTQQIAQLRFTSEPGQTSAFLPLILSGLTSTRADSSGLAPTPLMNHGRIVILDEQPLLEATLLPAAGGRLLNLYGKPGRTYTVEKSFQPDDSSSWVPLRSLTLPALQQTFPGDDDRNAPAVFYRAR